MFRIRHLSASTNLPKSGPVQTCSKSDRCPRRARAGPWSSVPRAGMFKKVAGCLRGCRGAPAGPWWPTSRSQSSEIWNTQGPCPRIAAANDPEPQRRGDGPPRPLSKLQRSLKVSARAGASNDPAWACGPWSRPERTGAKRRTLALGRALAPVWAIASVLARNERSRRMPGSVGRFGTD